MIAYHLPAEYSAASSAITKSGTAGHAGACAGGSRFQGQLDLLS